MKTIVIVTPCMNEEENIEDIYNQVKNVFTEFPNYRYKHLFIDNASTDRTVTIIKNLIKQDKNVQLIVNNRNFGHIRSPHYGLLQSEGDATVLIAADLQEPPELIKTFITLWEEGNLAVVGVKKQSKESKFLFTVRNIYYKLLSKMADVPLINNFTGFGLYDKKIINLLRDIDDPYPYFRGLISELGVHVIEVPYVQPLRKRGHSKYNFYSLCDVALLGFTTHSKVPLRLATLSGFFLALMSLFISLIYLLMKLFLWNSFSIGIAPIVIGLFFFTAVQLFFVGMLGEYIAQILIQVKKRPLVIEHERINVNFENSKPTTAQVNLDELIHTR